MNDAEIIAALQASASAIMHEPPATVTGEPKKRADRLEIAARYLVCCAILTGEIKYEQLKGLIS